MSSRPHTITKQQLCARTNNRVGLGPTAISALDKSGYTQVGFIL